jgi:hypothetical protein
MIFKMEQGEMRNSSVQVALQRSGSKQTPGLRASGRPGIHVGSMCDRNALSPYSGAVDRRQIINKRTKKAGETISKWMGLAHLKAWHQKSR